MFNIKKTIVMLMVCSAGVASINSCAANSMIHNDRGPYVLANAGLANYTFASFWGNHVDKISAPTGDVGMGYQFNQYFAVEAEYGLSEIRSRANNNTMMFNTASASIVGIFPLTQGVSVMAKLGAGELFMVSDGDGSDSKGVGPFAKIGLGASYKLTQKLAINGQVTDDFYGILNVVSYTAGMTYRI